MAFHDDVKKHGSVSAALKANGYKETSRGHYSKDSSSSSHRGSSGGVIGTAATARGPGSSSGGSSSSRRGSSGGSISSSRNYGNNYYRGGSSGGYDPNRDYSKAIIDAQRRGASASEIASLQQQRQNKINAQYGGRDPYRGSVNIMGSDRDIISRPGGQLYYDDGRKAVHNMGRPWEAGVDYSALAEQYAQKGNWDAVDDLLMRRAAKMQETGSQGGGRSNIDIWHDLNQRYNGPDSGMSLNDMYSGAQKAYGPGGKWSGNNAFPPPDWSIPQGGGNLDYGAGALPGIPGQNSADAYLRELYRQKMAAEEAQLKAAYDQNLGRLQAQDDLIGSTYAQQRNQAAAQNELERMRMAEMGIAQGLNTGATGQLALSQSGAYQGVLGGLAQQEAQDRAESQRAMSDLLAKYQSNLSASTAQNQAQLADALYQEYVRAQEQALAQAQREEEARRWQTEYDENNRRWQMEWDAQMKERERQNALERAQFYASQGDLSAYRALGWNPQVVAPPVSYSSGRRSSGSRSRSRSSGGRSSSKSSSSGTSSSASAAPKQPSREDDWKKGRGSYVMVPGYGRVTWQELESLIDDGYVKEITDKTGARRFVKK